MEQIGLSTHKRHEHMILGHFSKASLDITADLQDNPDPRQKQVVILLSMEIGNNSSIRTRIATRRLSNCYQTLS